RDIEFPLWISAVGIPIFAVLGAWATHAFFGVPWLLAFISLPLILVLTVICTNSMALTSWTPTGSLAKITQFTMGAIDRTNPASNLIPAATTGEIASHAPNPLSPLPSLPEVTGVRSPATIVSEQFAMPSAIQWKGVAELIMKGLKGLPASAVISIAVAAVAAIASEVGRIMTKGRFGLSAVAIGLGVILPPEATFAMFVGALFFWIMKLRHR